MEHRHANSCAGMLATEDIPLPPGVPPPQQPAADDVQGAGAVFLDDPLGGGPVLFTAALGGPDTAAGGLEQHHQEQLVHVATHQCPECGCFFLDQAEAEDHMKVHSTDADGAASTSKVAPSPPRRGQAKALRDSGQANQAAKSGGQFCCPVCDKAFVTVRSLRTHLLVHPGTKLHICQTCGRQFGDPSGLKLHAAQHVAERRFRCPVCGKAFGTSSHLKTHITLHSGRRPFQCEVCLKEFSVLSNLRAHMFTHTGERRHECQVCGKQFSSSSHVKTHMLTHSGERPHQCDLCHKSFAVISNLKAHRKIHLGQKDHQCDLCPKRFYTSSDLKSHRMMHTGERPHQCPVCHERFSKRSNMKAHILTHSGARPFQCQVCRKRFSKASNLRAHVVKCKLSKRLAAPTAASPKTSASPTPATATAATATVQGRPATRIALPRPRTPVPALYRPTVAPTTTTNSCGGVRVSSRESATTRAFRRNNAPDIPSAMATSADPFFAGSGNPLMASAMPGGLNAARVPVLVSFGSHMGRNHGVPLAVHGRPTSGHAFGMLRAVPYAAQFVRMAVPPAGFVNVQVRPAMGISRTGRDPYAALVPIGQVQYAAFMPSG